MFSTPANLGIVAYALVKGYFGDTPDLNSGISVIHTPGSDPTISSCLAIQVRRNPCKRARVSAQNETS